MGEHLDVREDPASNNKKRGVNDRGFRSALEKGGTHSFATASSHMAVSVNVPSASAISSCSKILSLLLSASLISFALSATYIPSTTSAVTLVVMAFSSGAIRSCNTCGRPSDTKMTGSSLMLIQ